MKKVLKMMLTVFCLLILALTLAGCGDDAETAPDDPGTGQSAEMTPGDSGAAGTMSVEQLNGTWWYRQTPVTGISVDIFCFEGSEVVFCDDKGNEVMRGPVKDNGDNTFVMTLEFFGDGLCRFDEGGGDWTITLLDSGAVFTPGETMHRLEIAGEYTGKWFKNGDLKGEYIDINPDGAYTIYAQIGDEAVVKKEGNWQLKDMNNSNDHGRSKYEVISLDDSIILNSFKISEDKTALWKGSIIDYEYYIKESVIGSPEGDLALQAVSLYCSQYWRPEAQETGSIYLTFYDDGYLMISTLRADGSLEETGGGSWKRTGDKFSLTLADGKEQTFAVSGDTLTLADGRTFGRKS